LTVDRPGVDGWWRKPADRWRGSPGNGLAWTVSDLVDSRRLAHLLTAEPPVLFIRVVLPVLEAPIRRGFALSHISMLTLSCSAVSIAATVAADQRIEVLM
jgi:hypothetical protein